MRRPVAYSRRHTHQLNRFRSLTIEPLERRCLMAVGNELDWQDIKSGPLAKTGQATIELIREFKQWQTQVGTNASQAKFAVPATSLARIENNLVEMEIIAQNDFAAAQQWLQTNGVEIGPVNPEFNVITGMVPLANLERIARSSLVSAMRLIEQPITSAAGIPVALSDGVATNTGSVVNQADAGQNVPAARSTFAVKGEGIKVGVISDSVSRFQGGLADSQATGDLGAVQVIQDGPVGGTDEGRAMLELVHDIAPKASLAFATANIGGQTGFANNIDALRTAGSKVIVDDITYFAEPMFQPGVIDLAVKRAVDHNIPYFSSAGNSARSGFERSIAGPWNIGTQYDWKTGAGVDTRMRISIDRNTVFVFQWDDAYNGIAAPGKVKTDLDVVIYSTSGTELLRLGSNNIATGSPVELFQGGPGTYEVALERIAGPIPSRIKLVAFRGTMTTEYASNSSSTYGHNAGPWTIGVGAVPFYEAPPFLNSEPILTESFTSTGPSTYLFDGVTQNRRLNSPVTYLNPFISGVDNVNTTFFYPGGDIPQDSDTLPNFAGTSAAAPNVAAVAALMRQKFPTARVNQIAQALADSARPVNGTADGVWNNRGGYGLIDALAAMTLLDQTVAGGQIVDNGDATFSASSNWVSSSGGNRFGNDSLLISAGATIESADYSFFYLPKGTYDVFARWLPGASRSNAVQYQIADGDLAESTVQVNQRSAPSGSSFAGLAWSTINRIVVTQGAVFVHVLSSATGSVSTDAIRLLFVSSSTSAASDAVAPPLQNSVATNLTTSILDSQQVARKAAANATDFSIPIVASTTVVLPAAKSAKPSSVVPTTRSKSSNNLLFATIDAAFAELIE